MLAKEISCEAFPPFCLLGTGVLYAMLTGRPVWKEYFSTPRNLLLSPLASSWWWLCVLVSTLGSLSHSLLSSFFVSEVVSLVFQFICKEIPPSYNFFPFTCWKG